MASLPAETNADAGLPAESGEATRSGAGGTGTLGRRMQDVLEGLGQLTVARQIGLMLGLSASIALGIVLALWLQEPDYRPLRSGLDPASAQEVVDVLEQMNARYRLDLDAGTLWVERARYYDAKMQLAQGGYLDRDSEGYEILDEDAGLFGTQFGEQERHRRALEGELERTIAHLRAVREARVHLALPRNSAFLRDRVPPSASVTVTLGPGRSLAPDWVRGIENLVAAAIPSMAPEHVKVVDQEGRLLSELASDALDREAQKQLEHKLRVEQDLLRKIGNVVEPVVGRNRFRAEVDATLDFTRSERTSELVDGNSGAVISEGVRKDQRVGSTVDGAVPGALSNQPPPVAQAPEQAAEGGEGEGAGTVPSRTTEERTTNRMPSRIIELTAGPAVRLDRLSVTLVVDDRLVPGAEGGASPEPWTEAALTDLRLAVQGAIGFDPLRDDRVTVINRPFAPEPPAPPPPPFWQESWFADLVRQVLIGSALLVLLLLVVRPIFRHLAASGEQSRLSELERDGEVPGLDLERPGDVLSLGAADGPLRLEADLSYANQLDAVRSMVADNPTRVAQVMKNWVGSDE